MGKNIVAYLHNEISYSNEDKKKLNYIQVKRLYVQTF